MANEDWCDLMVDELMRIKALLRGSSLLSGGAEIDQLCTRAIETTRQKVPVIQQRDEAQRKVEIAIIAFEKIREGKGAFSTNQLEHAENCIDDMKGIATKALEEIGYD